jgi:hypothetical protein
VPSTPGMFEPNSAPDSFAPSHCKAPDFEVLDDAAAVLDEAVGTLTLEEGIMLVASVARGELVEEVNVELDGAAKSSTAGEEIEIEMLVEVESAAEVGLVYDDAGLEIAEEESVVLEYVASGISEEEVVVELKEVAKYSLNEAEVETDMMVKVEKVAVVLIVDGEVGIDTVEWSFILLEWVGL